MHISYLLINKINYEENDLIDKILITTIYFYYYFINNIHYFNIFKLFFLIKVFTLLIFKLNKITNYLLE